MINCIKSKCFDTSIDHTFFVKKLHMYGITLKWFKQYLSSHKQCVTLKGLTSSYVNVIMGIPQGSIFGPILFLIFIKDFPSCINRCQCNIFADDAILYTQSSTLEQAQCELQTDLTNAIKWFISKRLHVNTTKSSCMVMNTHGNAVGNAFYIAAYES